MPGTLATMMLVNRTTGRRLAARVTVANGPWQRIVGWLGHRCVDADQGLWFERCDAVHTVGMRTSIDLIFLDARHRVQSVLSSVPPGRFLVADHGAATVIEMGPGFLKAAQLEQGDVLVLEPI
jgi:uncharacterized membrane protein (UPF0127 family)